METKQDQQSRACSMAQLHAFRVEVLCGSPNRRATTTTTWPILTFNYGYFLSLIVFLLSICLAPALFGLILQEWLVTPGYRQDYIAQ